MRTVFINIHGGPGIGKTTFASDLFSAIKKRHVDVEATAEFAKDLIRGGRADLLSNQLVLLGGQALRLASLAGRVPLVINDSPLTLCSIYASVYAPDRHPPAFHETVLWAHKALDNVDLVLSRHDHAYQVEGRVQDEKQAIAIDGMIIEHLRRNDVPHVILPTENPLRAALDVLAGAKIIPEK